jgi:hypothetical protein
MSRIYQLLIFFKNLSLNLPCKELFKLPNFVGVFLKRGDVTATPKGYFSSRGNAGVTVFWVYPQEWYCWIKW